MPHDFIDGATAGLLLLFTGTDAVVSTDTALDMIAKFGVIGVLWFWLQDMKKRFTEQKNDFNERSESLLKVFETDKEEIRIDRQKDLDALKQSHAEYIERLDKIISSKDEELKELKETLKEIAQKEGK